MFWFVVGPLLLVVCGFCSSQFVPSHFAVAIAVVVRSDAASAAPPTFVMVAGLELLTLRVGVVLEFALLGSQFTVKPALMLAGAGVSVTVCAFAVPPPAA
jgi:hypothetical protein